MIYQKTFTFFIYTFFIVLTQSVDIQAQSILTQKADSLFNAKDYLQATIAYEDLIAKHDINKRNAFVKMAFMAEQHGNFPKAIYYLSELYELSPNDELFDKINKIAKENGYGGFERTDFNFLITFYKQYYFYIVIILLLLAIFTLYYSFQKKSTNVVFPKRYAFLSLFVCLFALLVTNLPSTYNLGIVKAKEAFMRDAPSSGSELIGRINEGNRVNIIGKKDIWYQILWQRRVIYIKESDLWVING
ncbi:SH3 domain-containing protein [Spirosomataceae bacterium TFI 002]|nr:SH3 domain-containing protein [Spirosomataceae bacterium TFI 002]